MSLFDDLEQFREDLAARQFVLDQVRVRSQVPVESHLWSTLDIGVVEAAFGNLILSLDARVLQDNLPPKEVKTEHTVTTPPVPATWWDHFKVTKLEANKWYWRWLGKLKPPRMTVESKVVQVSADLSRWVSYPEAQRVPVELGQPYRGYTVGRVRTRDLG